MLKYSRHQAANGLFPLVSQPLHSRCLSVKSVVGIFFHCRIRDYSRFGMRRADPNAKIRGNPGGVIFVDRGTGKSVSVEAEDELAVGFAEAGEGEGVTAAGED